MEGLRHGGGRTHASELLASCFVFFLYYFHLQAREKCMHVPTDVNHTILLQQQITTVFFTALMRAPALAERQTRNSIQKGDRPGPERHPEINTFRLSCVCVCARGCSARVLFSIKALDIILFLLFWRGKHKIKREKKMHVVARIKPAICRPKYENGN